MTLLSGDSFKSCFVSLNPHLLILKVCYFLVYAVWICVLPYVALISTQIIDYRQLAILFACIPVISIVSPILTGFVADKMGNYKTLLVLSVLLAGTIYLPVLWLLDEYSTLKVYLASNISDFDNSTLSTSSSVPQHHYTFPLLMAIRIAGFIAFDAGNTLLDSSGLTMAQKYGGDFGKQKMWGTLAMVVLPILCGYLIDEISSYRGFLDYSVAFYMSTGIAIIVIPIIYKLDIQVKKNEHTMLKTAKKVMGMIDVDIFLLAEVVLGFCWGFHMNFISVYILSELQSSKTLFGVALGIGGLGSMIIISYTKAIISRMGEANTIAFSLMLYGIRFVVYYFLRTPWVVLMVESVEGLCGFLSIVAGSYYCAEAAPPGMLASLNGILASAVFGAGRGLGTTIGSILISAYGIRVTYLSFGIFAALASITYLTVYHSCLKRVEQRRLEGQTEQLGIKGIENPATELHESASSIPAISIQEKESIPNAANNGIEKKESKVV